MAKSDETAGSGIDKPEPKGIVERLEDGLKAMIPKKSDTKPVVTGNGTVQRLPD